MLATDCVGILENILVFHDKQIWQICQIFHLMFENYLSLHFKEKGNLYWSVITRMYALW